MLFEMGKQPPLKAEEFARVKNPVLLLLGDRDKMVTLQETAEVFRQLVNGQLAVLPDTPHPLEVVDEQYLSFLIRKFLQ